MAKKMKRYDDGGEIEFETKTGQNEAIKDDTRARAMKFLEEGESKPAAPKAAPKAVLKAEPKAAMKADMNDMPESLRAPDYKAPSVVKSVSKEITKPTARSPGKMVMQESEYAMKPSLQDKGERLMKSAGVRTSFKSGGKVKSASARADGCAIRGKTRA